MVTANLYTTMVYRHTHTLYHNGVRHIIPQWCTATPLPTMVYRHTLYHNGTAPPRHLSTHGYSATLIHNGYRHTLTTRYPPHSIPNGLPRTLYHNGYATLYPQWYRTLIPNVYATLYTTMVYRHTLPQSTMVYRHTPYHTGYTAHSIHNGIPPHSIPQWYTAHLPQWYTSISTMVYPTLYTTMYTPHSIPQWIPPPLYTTMVYALYHNGILHSIPNGYTLYTTMVYPLTLYHNGIPPHSIP
ncbi:hypothetical protein Baya_16489 [Bagarius yarrelli]|uniref:Uncharacterized protein n=1 Tax=Bagarius yarrelli TaxID=175774 RepID=A0A556VVN1_BAGYA|nr:hypothetical protein Baya_16489 [Bagarius yarrelli]